MSTRSDVLSAVLPLLISSQLIRAHAVNLHETNIAVNREASAGITHLNNTKSAVNTEVNNTKSAANTEVNNTESAVNTEAICSEYRGNQE